MTNAGLKGATAIVTGAARGIGLGIAERFSELGAEVIGWDVEMCDNPIFQAFFTCDVTSETSVAEAARASLARAGHVDILVNNAGVNGPTKPTWDYTLDEWNKVLAVDLTGVFLCTRALVGRMRARGYGRIVNIASIAGKEGGPNACAYAAAKSGVIGFTKGLAQELAGTGVLVNAIAPAITETDLFAEMTEDYIADRRRRIPMGRFCTIKEIADMTAFAASRECSFTTGFTFDVTGGRATY
ncbi:MAG: SDR family oxidoreductase [Alphaproteobacteria bacterium]|nr:SDR family oxidoreductase [Alphaproteobacteria bacterium]